MAFSPLDFLLGCLLVFNLCSCPAADDVENWRSYWNTRAATVARARAYSLAHPANTTARVFGPRAYEAPFLCEDSDLVVPIPRSYRVSLQQSYSITEHQATINRDIRPFIHKTFTSDLSITYVLEDVGEEILAAIRTDPGVWMASCNVRDNWEKRRREHDMESSPEWNSED